MCHEIENKLKLTLQSSASFGGTAQEKPSFRMKYFPRCVFFSLSSHWSFGKSSTGTLCSGVPGVPPFNDKNKELGSLLKPNSTLFEDYKYEV